MSAVFFGVATLAFMIAATSGLLMLAPRLYRAVAGEDAGGRMDSLDGLRGLLAICVVVHHGIITQAYDATGVWEAPENHFNNLLGAAAVALFFMVSAYLFWGRVSRARGPIDWTNFFRGRLYRLAPMYGFSVAILLLIVAVDSGFTLRVSPRELGIQVFHWFSFAFLKADDINGVKDTYTILSVLWSLRFEWILYCSLPLLALVWRVTGRVAPIYIGIVAISFLGHGYSYLVFFPVGMLAIHLKAWRPDDARVDAAWGVAGIASLVILCIFYQSAVGLPQAALLMVAFVAALRPAGVWTFLRKRVMRFLGHISYSVYLLHNMAIAVLAKWGFGVAVYATLDPLWLYGSTALLGVAVIVVSTATYLFIEKPFIELAAKPMSSRWPSWSRPASLTERRRA
jgi:peptidoglycan/LPS O-acetylase OafA/YrhL